MAFKEFLLDGEKVVSLPAHYAKHPVLGKRLVALEDLDEIETDKVVLDNHELPLSQRITYVAADSDTGAEDDSEDDDEWDSYDDDKEDN